MRALLDAMARARPTTRRIGVGVALLGTIGLVVALTRRPAPAVCVGAEDAWGQAWDAPRADAVRSTFTQSGRPSAAFAVAQVTRALDDYRTGSIAMHRDTCEATRVRGEQSEALLDLRMRCLDDHRKQVDALSQLLTTADDGVVDRSISATMSLPPILDCTNTQALTAAVPAPDDAHRATVDALNDRLAESNALEYAGQYNRGLEIARPALDAARATGYAPLISKLLLVSGRLNLGASDLASAETLLHEAAATAMDAREDLVAADAWTVQIRVVGMLGGRIAEANVYGRYAESAIRRAGGDDEREATRLRYVGIVVSRRAHKLEEGRELIERARAMFARSRGPRFDFDVASCDEGIAGIDFDRGHPEVALPLFVRVAEVRERLFGENHPSVAIALVNLGETLTKLGRAQEALPILRRSLELASRVTSKGYNAYEHHRIAAALRALGESRRRLRRGRPIARRVPPRRLGRLLGRVSAHRSRPRPDRPGKAPRGRAAPRARRRAPRGAAGGVRGLRGAVRARAGALGDGASGSARSGAHRGDAGPRRPERGRRAVRRHLRHFASGESRTGFAIEDARE